MALELVQQQVIGINQEALDEWMEYRDFKKKPLSPMALKKSVKLLIQYDEEHQQAIIDKAIMNDWIGLHPFEKATVKPTVTGDTSWLQMD